MQYLDSSLFFKKGRGVLSRLWRVAEDRRRMSDLWTDYAIRAAKLLKANWEAFWRFCRKFWTDLV